ncbi:MAG: hypothetical protein NTV50_08660 [Planctomycetota bacterium]|nr:hypothetical protein [Planctomycetota bacterium]
MRKWVIGIVASFLVLSGLMFVGANKKAEAEEVGSRVVMNDSLNTEAAQRYRKVQPKHWRAAMVKGFGYSAMR